MIQIRIVWRLLVVPNFERHFLVGESVPITVLHGQVH